MSRLYCTNCKYYVPSDANWAGNYCKKYLTYKHTPLGIEFCYLDYQESNEYNNCKYYKREWWKFWIGGVEWMMMKYL